MYLFKLSEQKGKTNYATFERNKHINMDIIFATNNLHKINEISSVIDSRFKLIGLKESGISEDIPEEEDTLEGNALAKARYVFERTGKNVFADDTGLEVDSLDNRPGVLSARYAGDQKDSEDNISKLLHKLDGNKNRSARFRTIIALIISGEEYLFEGEVRGTIIESRKGTKGFGYDPVFKPENSETTFAQMDLEEKNLVSHRARAMKKLIAFLNNYSKQ